MAFDVIGVIIDGKTYDDVEAGMSDLANRFSKSFDLGSQRAGPLLLQALQLVAQQLAKRHGASWNGGVVNTSNNLQVRSGEGLASIIRSVRNVGTGGQTIAAAQISTGTMGIHETGGVIRATRSQYLTIPLPAALDPRGVPLRARARDWDNTFVKPSKKGNLIIFRKMQGARAITPLYILKTEVTIRARLGMEPAIDEQMGYFETKLWNDLSDAIDQYL